MDNRCLNCGVDMGDQNPRQLCRKTYCPEVFPIFEPGETVIAYKLIRGDIRKQYVFIIEDDGSYEVEIYYDGKTEWIEKKELKELSYVEKIWEDNGWSNLLPHEWDN